MTLHYPAKRFPSREFRTHGKPQEARGGAGRGWEADGAVGVGDAQDGRERGCGEGEGCGAVGAGCGGQVQKWNEYSVFGRVRNSQ